MSTLPKKAGAPRVWSLPPEDMIKLGEEMVAWVEENKPVHLTQWWSIHKKFPERHWVAMQQMPEFVPYYQRAMHLIGMQYLLKNSEVEPYLKARWLRMYFKDLRQVEDAEAKEAAKIKAEAAKGDIRAAEEERQRVIETIQRNNQPIKA
jgi:hypothetical protein